METADFISSTKNKIRQSFFVQAQQDGLCFGLNFLNLFLEENKEEDEFELQPYVSEGECVFKDQTLLKCDFTVNESLNKENLFSLISYFSGAYTLLSCFTEKNFNFSVYAGSTPDFHLAKWEEESILKAGAFIGKPPELICDSAEDVEKSLDKAKSVVLSNLKMSHEEIKKIIDSLPSSVEVCLYGAFLPSDLEEFENGNLRACYPICLQGHFPQMKMNLAKLFEKSY